MCSVTALLDQWCVDVDAALELVRAGPASRALVLTRADGTRARDAADRRIARVVQRVVGNLVHVDVRLHALRVPVDERLDLPDAEALRPLDLLGVRASRALLAPNPCDPRVVRLEGTLEWLDLADVAAAIRIALPQIRPLLDGLPRDRDDLGTLEPEAVALHEPVARLVGLLEE